MIQVVIYKETSSPIQKESVRKVVHTILKTLNRNRYHSLSVAIVKTNTIRTLNRIWRGIDRPTSVLSFSAQSYSKSQNKRKKNKSFVLPPEEKDFLGEIIIADSIVKKEAKQRNSSYHKEFNYLFVHGLLHLLGYQHSSLRLRKKMEKLENRILNNLKT